MSTIEKILVTSQATGAETTVDFRKLFEPYEPVDTTLCERLMYWAAALPDAIAFRFLVNGEDETIELTNRELDKRAKAVAAELVSRGFNGQPALLLYPPGLDFIIAFFGCHYAGAIPVPAYPPRRNRNMGRINAISEDCQAAVALSVRDVISRNEGMLDDAPSLNNIPWIATEEIAEEMASDWVKPSIKPNDVGLIQYTSGSTGTPKGVMLSHANLISNCRMITLLFGQDRDNCGVSWLPAYHDMGLIGGILQPLYYGCTMNLMSPVSFLTKPIRWLKAISKYGAGISGAPNFAYQLCAEKATEKDIEGLDLSCWNVAFNGAEPIRTETLNSFSEIFSKVGFKHTAHYACYGMAETTLIVTGSMSGNEPVIRHFDRTSLDEQKVVTVDANNASARALVGCGRALPGTTIKIVSPETREVLGDNQIGEIWVDTPGVGLGYWRKPNETAETFQATMANGNGKPLLRTGDLGFVHDGELFVTGRLKDLIIVRGVNKYPQDIEASVENSSSRLRTAGAAAFAVEHASTERLVVVCEVERGQNKEWADVLQAVRSNVTAEHDIPPDAVVLVRAGSVPKTSSGKVQRKQCKQQFLDNKLLVVARWSVWDHHSIETETSAPAAKTEQLSDEQNRVVPIVCDAVKSIAQERAGELDIDTNIVVDLGLDSLERLQIAYSLEETFGGRIPDEVLQEIETIGEISDAIIEHVGSEPIKQQSVTQQQTKEKPEDFEIPDAYYRIDKMPEFIRVQQLKMLLTSTGVRNPFFSVHEGRIGDTTQIEGRELISFASYNYLGYSGEPAVTEAAINAVQKFGTSVSASRIVSGEKTVHKTLETELAQFLGVDDVITFPGGHAMNETVIGHIVGPGDLIVHDSLAHNSLIQGAELSGARRRPFAHNDWAELDKILDEIRHEYRRVLIVIEGLYSMDGDFPDLVKFVEIKKKHKAWIYLDEAHSIGTLGETGRGIGETFGVDRNDVEFWMGTLSKSFGSCGGFVGGRGPLIEYLRYTTPGFVFAAGIPPANVAAALASLRLLAASNERVQQLQNNCRLFLKLAKEAGLDTGLSDDTPIVPVIIGDSLKALQTSEKLFHAGINAQPILHPAVAEAEARVRFFITALHSDEQIKRTVDTTAQIVSSL